MISRYRGSESCDVFQAVIDDADDNPIALLPPVRGGGVDAAEIGAVGQSFFHLQAGILACAPQQDPLLSLRLPTPEFVTGEEPVGHAQHSFAEQRNHFLSQREFIGGVSIHVRAPQHVCPILQQCHKPYLGEMHWTLDWNPDARRPCRSPQYRRHPACCHPN